MACYLRLGIVQSTTLNMDLGRSRTPYGITWPLSISSRGSRTGLWFLIYKNKQNIEVESCLCQTNSRWFFDIYRNIKTILTCIWLLLQLIKEIKLCLTTKLSRISRLTLYDQCFFIQSKTKKKVYDTRYDQAPLLVSAITRVYDGTKGFHINDEACLLKTSTWSPEQ